MCAGATIGGAECWPAGKADDDAGRGEKIFQASLLRVVEMNAGQLGVFFTQRASDRLKRGSVQVRRKREVEIELKGAARDATCLVYFCRLGTVPSDCLPFGKLETDANGDATARWPFDPAGQQWSGVFVLTRADANHFVSGFRFPSEAVSAAAVEVLLRGRIAALAPASFLLSGFPLESLVTRETRFEKVSGVANLKPGDEVEVWAYTRADGAIAATRVRLDGKPDPPGRAFGLAG